MKSNESTNYSSPVAEIRCSGLASVLQEENREVGRPWSLTAAQAYSSHSGDEAFVGSSHEGEALPAGQASVSSGSPAAQAAAEVGPSQPLPPGYHDFKKKQLIMMFTCGQCEVRAARAFSKAAYETGVVIVECPGCQSRHLIAGELLHLKLFYTALSDGASPQCIGNGIVFDVRIHIYV
jgi:hypothetical protein